ncbi:MAG: transketolase [Gemmataceae bacterium]|nr:transketolase [Gemmataceae bacterium]MDW8265553.1 transketolase [Gemmataceae bacterium]
MTVGPTHPGTLDERCINTIRFLAVDAVQKANSGHPGLPMGAAAFAYVLWDRFLKFNPRDPHWPDRDRFVLSAGHGSMLLYGLLHLYGFDVTLDDIQQFRQLHSRTPGHPEYGLTPGVEATTGPLGQGIANAVGMAIAERHLAARFNRPGHTIVDHYTYVLCSDGDLMEGVSAEACSLAGHLRLGKLIVLYDDNRVSLEAVTDVAFTEDRLARYAAYGWHVQRVDDGNDLAAVHRAIQAAQAETERPSFIALRTHIGYGSPHKQDTHAAHGEPLGKEEVRLTKERLGWPTEPPFLIPPECLAHFREAVPRGQARQAEWEERFRKYAAAFPELAQEFQRTLRGELPAGWDSQLPTFTPSQGPMATRIAGSKALNALAARVPELIGGSADLNPSTFTYIDGGGDFQAGSPAGRNLHFGVREHAMGAIVNGLALHKGCIPYSATFLVFSDYMRPPIRLAALSHLPAIFVFTHDSIALGEDGPTHQPVEQLLGLRSVPGLTVLRPADANETAQAWWLALARRRPTALVLTRQKVPVLDLARFPHLPAGVRHGGYVLSEAVSKPVIVLLATGSEVHLALASQETLASQGVAARVVSMPSWEVFAEQPDDYRRQVLPPGVPVLVIEAAVPLGWRSYLGGPVTVLGVDRFGASAPGEVVMKEYGFTVDHVCRRVMEVLGRD